MFEVTTVYDHRAMTLLSRVVRKTQRRIVNILLRVLVGLFAAVLTVFMLLLYWLGAFLWDLPTALMILCALLLVALILFQDHINGWIGGGMTYGYRQEAKAVLDEGAYTVALSGGSGRWEYASIRAFCETKDYFVFLLDKKHGQLFDKSGFTKGTPEAFREFVTEKTGLPVRFVK